jgi:hypothetical protein
MFLYVGKYWVPFPSSEYGGSWVVMAESEEQCISLLTETYTDEVWDKPKLIPDAVKKAQVFQLDESVASNQKPRIVDTFFT